MISTSYRNSTGTSERYDPLSIKVGYSIYENNVVGLIPYINGEINPQGFSALAIGYYLTAFQRQTPGSIHFVLDVRGLSRTKNFSGIVMNRYGIIWKGGFGYSFAERKYLEVGATLEETGNFGLEFGYSQLLVHTKKIKVPRRYRKPKHLFKCP